MAPDVAWRTMADHVLTDLGAFKTYGPIDVGGTMIASPARLVAMNA